MTWPWALAGSAFALAVGWGVWAYYRYQYLDNKDERQATLEAGKLEFGELLGELERARRELNAANARMAQLEGRQ